MSASTISFFTAFSPPPEVGLKCKTASMTRQEYADECDLNKIMERYAKGVAPIPTGTRMPQFGDFADLPDYQDMLNRVIDAQERFMQLPSDIRRRFDNDPAELLAFLAHESNRAEAIKLGLVSEPQKPLKQPNQPSDASGASTVPSTDGGQ